MADSVPPIPPADADPEVRVPDPHRGEPLPPADAGVRPEAVASGVRPEQDEPGGPLPGLVAAGAAEVEEEVAADPGAEALLAQMGVEDEGIETGQIMGTVAAILFSVVVLIVALIWFVYEPFRAETTAFVESEARYEELESTTAAGLSQLTDYRTAEDGFYAIPIDRAMGMIAATGGEVPAGGVDNNMPSTRAGFNTAWIDVSPPRAVQAPSERGARTAPAPVIEGPDGGLVPDGDDDDVEAAGVTNEAVGVDDPDDVE